MLKIATNFNPKMPDLSLISKKLNRKDFGKNSKYNEKIPNKNFLGKPHIVKVKL